MSANAAELMTLVSALRDARRIYKTPEAYRLLIVGDSRIALKWANPQFTREPSQKSSPLFIEAIGRLREELKGWTETSTQWQPRAKSVASFGH